MYIPGICLSLRLGGCGGRVALGSSGALVSFRGIYRLRLWPTYHGAKAAVCARSNLGPYLAHSLIYMAILYSVVSLTAPL